MTFYATTCKYYSSNLLGLSLAIPYIRFLVFSPLPLHFYF